jgi:DNA-binding Lrp family transcriptional regulator
MSKFMKCPGCNKPVLEEWNSCPFCTTALPFKKAEPGESVEGVVLVVPVRDRVKDVAMAIAQFDTVRDSFIVTGDAGVYVKAEAGTFAELKDFVVNVIGSIEGVQDSRTYMVVSSLKEMKENAPDPGKDPVRAILMLKVDQHKKDELASTLIALDFVEDVLLVSGDHDIVVKGLFPTYNSMKDFVSEWVGDLGGVSEQKTFMAVEIYKEHGLLTKEAEIRAKAANLKDITLHFPSEKELFAILTNLPRGIPSHLWGLEMDDLVTSILKAKYGLTPRGYPVMNIKGKWFRGDIDDTSNYLAPYEGDVITEKIRVSKK